MLTKKITLQTLPPKFSSYLWYVFKPLIIVWTICWLIILVTFGLATLIIFPVSFIYTPYYLIAKLPKRIHSYTEQYYQSIGEELKIQGYQYDYLTWGAYINLTEQYIFFIDRKDAQGYLFDFQEIRSWQQLTKEQYQNEINLNTGHGRSYKIAGRYFIEITVNDIDHPLFVIDLPNEQEAKEWQARLTNIINQY